MTQKEYDQALIVLCDDLNKIKDENNEIRISSLENGDVLIKAEELAKVAQKSTYNFLKSMGYYLLKDSVRSTREIINYLSSISDEDKIVIINHSDANYFSLENKAQRENLTRDNWVALHSNNELCLYVVGNNEDEYITRRLSHYADKNGIVYDLHIKDTKLNFKIKEQSKKYGMGRTEYVQTHTPYKIYSANFFAFPENINYYLSKIATEDGFVDSILGTKEMRVIAKCLKKQEYNNSINSERLLLQDYIEKNTNFKLHKSINQIDYKKHLQTELLSLYPNKRVSGLRQENQTLYEQVRNYRNYHSFKSISQALNELGFIYLSGKNINSFRYTNEIIKNILLKAYPDGKIPSDFHKVISKHILATYSGNKSASEYFKFLGLDPQFESRKETRIQRNIVNNESFANED